MGQPPEERPPHEADEETPTEDLQTATARGAAEPPFSPGQILGQRFRIESFLGRGGMGEVWRAFDLKLRVDVAFKSIRRDQFGDPLAMERLRREVRSAREVVSPSVCRIFDLVEVDGNELVSMEFIDGTTLVERLRDQGPMELGEATRVASQFLAGLDAIHRAGLVHRDVKPENIMVTRAGRVVLMDFGLTRPTTEAGVTMSGTPAYMAPEQVRGDALDARTDIFAAGVVLAEMISPTGIRDGESRQALQRGIRRDPPQLPESPWRPVLQRAVAKDPSDRFASTLELMRALEEVTQRVDEAEDLRPYPGLTAFTECDTDYFFGREAEIEEVWTKLQRAQLLALIGPSGAGKSSFLRAGLLPSMPAGWRCIVVKPGDTPVVTLGRALAPELAGDSVAMADLVQFDDPDVAVSTLARWRGRHTEALLIVDQFEELFTQNSPEVQERFAGLLGRVAMEADVHVLLSVRDDFLFRCHSHTALSPLFSEITPLGPPTGAALRRAVVQPAQLCGYRFEDESLVETMLGQVAGERGALPLLAFSLARLWEERKPEQGLLTREAYDRIGGVGGALARHAETTLERIGSERLPLVRELFRNLVTAEGTRVGRDVDELLSAFGDRRLGEEVLGTLIDSRLLTSFETGPARDDEAESVSRVEIVHESLLTAWPRLVRWRTQDSEGAQLRDQLRQAARLWQERGRPSELLWTGQTYREYELWRERYPGPLPETEEEFARAMVTHAGRKRRMRRIAMTAAFVLILGIAGTMATLWRESVRDSRRAEANELFALAQLALTGEGKTPLETVSATGPTVAMAYTIAALERSDGPTLREFAVKTLWNGPMAVVPPDGLTELGIKTIEFSPDGHWLAAGPRAPEILVWSEDGGTPLRLEGHGAAWLRFSPDSRTLVSGGNDSTVRFWSLPSGELLRTIETEQPTLGFMIGNEGRLATATPETGERMLLRWQFWSLDVADPTELGRLDMTTEGTNVFKTKALVDVDPNGSWLAYARGRDLLVLPLAEIETARPRFLGRHETQITRVAFHPDGRSIAAHNDGGSVRFWPVAGGSAEAERTLPHGPFSISLEFDRTGSRLASVGNHGAYLWDLFGPGRSKPLWFRWNLRGIHDLSFHPTRPWIATGDLGGVALWPTSNRYHSYSIGEGEIADAAFGPDGRWLAVSTLSGEVWLLPMNADTGEHARKLLDWDHSLDDLYQIAVDPRGRYVVTTAETGGPWFIPLDGGAPRRLEGFQDEVQNVAIGPQGRLVAASGGQWNGRTNEKVTRVWNLETGEVRTLPGRFGLTRFAPDGRLLRRTPEGLFRWDAALKERELLLEGFFTSFDITADGRFVVTEPMSGPVTVHDMEKGTSWELTSHGNQVSYEAFDDTGTRVLTGDLDGVLRVGPLTGEEPSLLLGHEGTIYRVSLDPTGKWIASVEEGSLRIWPMPEGRPLQTLAHEALLERLRSLTNLRVVPDEESPNGYRLEAGPFAGWKSTPE